VRVNCLILLVMLWFVPLAQSAEPPAQSAAKALYAKGKVAFDSGRFDVAATLFKEAYDTHPDPAYLFNVALAYERKPRWALAVEYYDRFLREAPSSPATPAVKARREAAAQARNAAKASVSVVGPPNASVQITSVGGAAACTAPCVSKVDPGPVSVVVDHQSRQARAARTLGAREQWAPALHFIGASNAGTLVIELDTPGATITVGDWPIQADEPLSLTAGDHLVVVRYADRDPIEQTVRIVEGKTRTLRIQSDAAGAGDPDAAQRISGYALVGVGGAALINGIVFAALAQSDFDEASSIVDGVRTVDSEAELTSLRERVETRSIIADVSFGVAAVSTAVGLALWLTADEPSVSVSARGGQSWSVIRF
jgi:hypothetical protein